ncbi:hypothetical protein [Sulfitobacter sabulilitoris]|nr:hypothetical protein [Sulfitobacter sabulilitoris]
MSGYQFAHVEVYSAKGAPGGQAKKKNGQRAWTAQEILDEAERLELASMHVAEGGPPPEIIPGEVDDFPSLRDAQVRASSKKESFPYTEKDGTVSKRQRKLRADAASLYTCVISLPVLTEDALADPALKSDCMRVMGQAMEHERKRLESLGGRMMMGVVHWDERNVHVHLYGLDLEKGRVDHLHPGRSAKTAFHEAHKGKSAKDVKKAANAAYCDAMREWQNDLHRDVFSDAGLLRFGPRRARLSTAEYNKLKAAKAQEAVDTRRADAAKARRATYEGALADIVRKAGSAIQESAKASNEVAKRKVDLLVREGDAEGKAALAEQEINRGREMSHNAEAKMRAIEVGLNAIETRQMDYRPEKEKKPEGLKFGPAAPKDKAKRTTLADAVRPAYDFLVGIAKRAFRLRQKEADLTQKEAEQADERRHQEAEMRRRAAILEKTEKAAGRNIPDDIAAIAQDRPLENNHDDFPGACFVTRDMDFSKLSEKFDETTNLDLMKAHRATSDAVLICQERPEILDDFVKGQQAIEAVAALRGFDLETGKHDPAKAADKALATRHEDQLPDPIKVVRKDLQRQRQRGD